MIPGGNISNQFYLRDSLAPISVRGRTIVIKYGGSAMTSIEASTFARDAAALKHAGARVVIVHGGGSAITSTAARLGVETTFVDGQRYTDAETIDVVMMVLAGRLNKEVVRLLCRSGSSAVGLSGVDGELLQCVRLFDSGIDLGLVGKVIAVRTELLELLLQAGQIPVIAPAAVDSDGTIHNINADMAASSIAGALRADLLLFMSDVAGVRIDNTVVSRLASNDARSGIISGSISGGMIPKVNAALEALDAGVSRVRIVDGRIEGIIRQSFIDEDIGTEIVGAPLPQATKDSSPLRDHGVLSS